jgi:hypothetical protein
LGVKFTKCMNVIENILGSTTKAFTAFGKAWAHISDIIDACKEITSIVVVGHEP